MKATRRPWLVTDDVNIITSDDKNTIGHTRCDYGLPVSECKANAAHIVKVVNLHDELINSLSYALRVMNHTPESLRGPMFDAEYAKIKQLLRKVDSKT